MPKDREKFNESDIDKAKTLIDPTTPCMQREARVFGRQMKREVDRVILQQFISEEVSLFEFLHRHTSATGSFSVSFNPHRLSNVSPETFYSGKAATIDLNRPVYRLTWHPTGTMGGMVSIMANTLGVLREGAVKILKIDLNKTGEKNNG